MWDIYQEHGIDCGHIRGTNLSDCTLQSFELKYCLGVLSKKNFQKVIQDLEVCFDF